MKLFKKQFIGAALMLAMMFGVAALPVASVAGAVDPAAEIKNGVSKAGGGNQQLTPKIKDVINVLLFVVGTVAVVMIIVGGLRYVLSNGDSSQISSAKNTILYAVIGLIVALLSYAIVNFVTANF